MKLKIPLQNFVTDTSDLNGENEAVLKAWGASEMFSSATVKTWGESDTSLEPMSPQVYNISHLIQLKRYLIPLWPDQVWMSKAWGGFTCLLMPVDCGGAFSSNLASSWVAMYFTLFWLLSMTSVLLSGRVLTNVDLPLHTCGTSSWSILTPKNQTLLEKPPNALPSKKKYS